MKFKSLFFILVYVGILFPVLFCCKKESIKTVPTATIAAITNITSTSASSGGEITSDGGSTVTSRGVCWSTGLNPTTADNKISNGTGKGSFTSPITGLTPGTNYTIRVYAINSVGTAYSSQAVLTTLALLPVLTTNDISAVTASTATSGGNIRNDGGAAITARGVCWSKNQTPTISDAKTSDGTGSGIFTSNITGLSPGTTYYVRAYATNIIGTAYGNQVIVTASTILPLISTSALSAITSTTATIGGNITSDGGSAVTAQGVCWSLNQNPTIADNKTSDGPGSGNFTSSITGLTPGATYYFRAYATNTLGTAYGNQVTATTTATLPVISTTGLSAVTSTSVILAVNIASEGGSPVTLRGVCWSTGQNPTIADAKTSDGTGSGIFTSSITGLIPAMTYYIRAYAMNIVGTTYGDLVTATTTTALPTITTTMAADIGSTSAVLGGNIISDGGAPITERGVYWGTAENPETNGTKLKSDPAANEYNVILSDIIPGTNYYVKAYAINSNGISYGNQISFTTNEFKLAVVDISKETSWDYWIIAKNGDSFYIRESSLKPTIVMLQQSGSDSGIPVFFNQQGFPEKVIINDYIFIFGNYHGNLVDIAVLLPNGNTEIIRNVETQVNWDLLRQKNANSLVSGFVNWTGRAVGAVPCALSIAATVASSGAGWPLMAWKCGTYSLSLAADIAEDEFGVTNGFTDFAKNFGLANLGLSCKTVTSDCLISLASKELDFLSDNLKELDSRKDQVNDAGTLIATGFKVSTSPVNIYADVSALVGGIVTPDGVINIVERGVFYGTSPNPEVTGTMFLIGNGSGNFSSTLSGLTPNTTYYIRSYAKSSLNTNYGSQVSFKTSAHVLLPSVTTSAVSLISTTWATGGGNVTSDGGSTFTARGVCWSTTPSPYITNSKTSDGTGAGSFNSTIFGLTSNTTYYVRAYASNNAGTTYGGQVSFKTSQTIALPTVTTNSITNIGQTTAGCGGNVTSDGGASVSVRGVCWSTSQSPTTANFKSTDGSGINTFLSGLTGLTPNTTYYVKAYATNLQGTGYGGQVSFTTASGSGTGTVTDIDGNIYTAVTIGSQVWMVENLKTTRYRNGDLIPVVTAGATWGALTTGAYCNYDNDVNNSATYGRLYNWYAAVDSRNPAPAGWHIPSDAEWTNLTNFLGGQSVAGGKLKESGTSHWLSPNVGATNSSGFKVVPGGYRVNQSLSVLGIFGYFGTYGVLWSTSSSSTTNGSCRYLETGNATITWTSGEKSNGFSIRCIKD